MIRLIWFGSFVIAAFSDDHLLSLAVRRLPRAMRLAVWPWFTAVELFVSAISLLLLVIAVGVTSERDLFEHDGGRAGIRRTP